MTANDFPAQRPVQDSCEPPGCALTPAALQGEGLGACAVPARQRSSAGLHTLQKALFFQPKGWFYWLFVKLRGSVEGSVGRQK